MWNRDFIKVNFALEDLWEMHFFLHIMSEGVFTPTIFKHNGHDKLPSGSILYSRSQNFESVKKLWPQSSRSGISAVFMVEIRDHHGYSHFRGR